MDRTPPAARRASPPGQVDPVAPPRAVPDPPRTVGPLMEMFGFGEPSDSPWVTIVPEQTAAAPPSPSRHRNGSSRSPVAPETARPGGKPTVFDSLPRLADLAKDRQEHENTGTLIERMWEATDDFADLDAWKAKNDYAERLGQRATLRWLTAIVMLVVVSGAIALLLAGRRTVDPAATARVAVIDALTENEAAAADLRAALEVIADPAAGGTELNEAAQALSRFDTATRRLRAAAQTMSLTDPAAAQLAEATDRGIALERRAGAVLTYRLLFDRAFTLPPDLPTEADLATAADLSFALSSMVSDTGRVLDQLPFDPDLEPHRRSAAQALADVEVVATNYTDALREGQSELAERHRTTLLEIVSQPHIDLMVLLPDITTAIELELAAYEDELADASPVRLDG